MIGLGERSSGTHELHTEDTYQPGEEYDNTHQLSQVENELQVSVRDMIYSCYILYFQ